MTTTLWLRISSIVSFLFAIHIFPVPVAFSAVLTACLGVALFLAR